MEYYIKKVGTNFIKENKNGAKIVQKRNEFEPKL